MYLTDIRGGIFSLFFYWQHWDRHTSEYLLKIHCWFNQWSVDYLNLTVDWVFCSCICEIHCARSCTMLLLQYETWISAKIIAEKLNTFDFNNHGDIEELQNTVCSEITNTISRKRTVIVLQVQVQMKCLNLPPPLGVSNVLILYATRLKIYWCFFNNVYKNDIKQKIAAFLIFIAHKPPKTSCISQICCAWPRVK